MRMKLFFTIAITLALFVSNVSSQEVLVDMPQQQGYVGIPLRLVVVYKNVTTDNEPSIPAIDGFTITKHGGTETSSQTTFINGKVTSSSTSKHTFFLTPQRLGELTIPALTFIADGKAFQSSERVIRVIETPTSGALKAEVTGTNGDVYLGQPVDLTLRIFVEQYIDKALNIELDAKDMFSTLRANSTFGVFTEALQDGRAHVQQVRGTTTEGIPATFFVYEVQATAWPETTGSLFLDPVSIVSKYPLSLAQQRSTGFFGGNSLVIDQSQLIIALPEVPAITVLTPPEQGRPDWYTGAVGSFTFRVVAQPTEVNVGEPITLTMRITDTSLGPVNLDYLSAPSLDRVPALTQSFKVPDKPLGGTVQGRTKTFTTTIRARKAGVTEIPALPMSSFNPTAEQFETMWTNPIPITVHAVDTVTASDLIGGTPSQTENSTEHQTEVAGGILANYIGDDLLLSQTTEWSPSLLASIALPPFACSCLAFGIFIRKQSRSEVAVTKYKRRKAIKTIRTLATSGNANQAQQVAKALRALDPESSSNVELTKLLQRCDASQFGGAKDVTLAQDANAFVDTYA